MEVMSGLHTTCFFRGAGSENHGFIQVQHLVFKMIQKCGHTFPKTNIAPENGWLEYNFPFGKPYFQGT